MRRPGRKKKASLLSQVLGVPFWVFAVVALAAGTLTWELKGPEQVRDALQGDLAVLLFLAPRVLGGMLLAGLVQAVLPPEMVSKWVGGHSGIRGLVIASIVGALPPGGPMTSFPIVAAFSMRSEEHTSALQ